MWRRNHSRFSKILSSREIALEDWGGERKVKIEGWRNAVGEKMANYISASATNRGKATHTLIENHLRNEDSKSMGITAIEPLGMFRIIQPYLNRIDNIHGVEAVSYTHLTLPTSDLV